MSSTKRKASEISLEEDTTATLHWNMDPSESFSDWTVKVTDKTTDQVKTYHVHRNIVAVGPRKSEYFVGVFRSSLNESADKTTRLALESKQATAFPNLLDYLYSGELKCDVQHVVALACLADYFLIPAMRSLLQKRRRKDLQRLSTFATYYKDAEEVGHQETLDDVARLFPGWAYSPCSWIEDEVSSILREMDPDFFLKLHVHNKSSFWERVLLKFLTLHEPEINLETLHKLVDFVIPPDHLLTSEQFSWLVDFSAQSTKLQGCLPADIQRRGLGNIMHHLNGASKTSQIKQIWSAIGLARKISNLDETVLSDLHESIVDYLEKCPQVLEDMAEDGTARLHTFLPQAKTSKLFTILLKQCKSYREQVSRAGLDHAEEVKQYKEEIRKFRRFDRSCIRNAIVSSHNRSGSPKPGRVPSSLPKGGDPTVRGWMFLDYYKKYPLYIYDKTWGAPMRCADMSDDSGVSSDSDDSGVSSDSDDSGLSVDSP